MTETDFDVVCSKINEEKEFLNSVSQDIWKTPELAFKEEHAHALLTCALKRHGFQVEKQYLLSTAFRAEYSSRQVDGVTVAILLEYDALPEIGHACGHNLISEAGLAAAIGVKAALENDPSIAGKLVVLGTPGEEGGGGKIKLIAMGAFEDVDVALMVHPFYRNELDPYVLNSIDGFVNFIGKEEHTLLSPCGGANALDAAVACYQNIALLRQQIKPDCRINAIITKAGTAVDVIPASSSMAFLLRTTTLGDLKSLVSRVEACITSAAEAANCEAKYSFKKENTYENLITNEVLLTVFKRYLKHLGFTDLDRPMSADPAGSTDMGNVSHKVPSIHPLYFIPGNAVNHTKEFTKASGADFAQEPTLIMAKAMALTALHVMRWPKTLEAARKEFQLNIQEDLQIK